MGLYEGDMYMTAQRDDLMKMAVSEMNIAIANMVGVPETIEDIVGENNKTHSVMAIKVKTLTGEEHEMLFQADAVRQLGEACVEFLRISVQDAWDIANDGDQHS